jgi:hypothetical protein
VNDTTPSALPPLPKPEHWIGWGNPPADWLYTADQMHAYARAALAAKPEAAPPVAMADDTKLWLWKNGDHFLAFTHEYPCFAPGGDPMTLGNPAAIAKFRGSYDRAAPPVAAEPQASEPIPDWLKCASCPGCGSTIVGVHHAGCTKEHIE